MNAPGHTSTTVAVAELAEFVHRRGDLYPPLKGRASAEEGIRLQRLAQSRRGEGYLREHAVSETFEIDELSITVAGRIDGCELHLAPPVVEEYKTTRAPAALAEQYLGSAHWAQATLYACLLARKYPAERSWKVRLLYCHPDTELIVPFEKTLSADSLAEYLRDTLAQFAAWLAAQQRHVTQRNRWVSQQEFPFPEYRPHQRAMARRVYGALRDGEHLLLEAPTGSGKTLGIVYPALKSLASGHHDRLFYLTSRNTGASAARQAVTQLDTDSLRYVEIISKEKACPVAGMPCDAERCKYAHGYFDRIHAALADLLTHAIMDPETVRDAAERHSVCPFELSLDAALWSDVIVGDYNYLLDPVVRLQRFADDARLAVLIDESHQLAERTRGMLSLQLDRSALQRALQESPPAQLCSRIKSIDRALLKIRREADVSEQRVIELPQSLLRAIGRCSETLAELARTDAFQLEAYPDTRELVFNLSRWVRSENWRSSEEFCFLARAWQRNIVVEMQCLDPGPYLNDLLNGYGAHVRFSGTLTPLSVYQRLHGQSEAPAERVESAFTPEQLSLLIVDDLPVYLQQRAETLSRLVDLVADVCQAQPGNYLVALPSFEYLNDFAGRFEQRHAEQCLVVQRPHMSDTERAEFLESFRPPHIEGDNQTVLGVVVLGGIFGESVDFTAAQLNGVICVGVGLPPPGPVREEIARHFAVDSDAAGGKRMAYLQPAMTKVVQMAGRLLRGPADRGVICLIDGRFRDSAYQAFFPRHWRPEVVKTRDVAQSLENFWRQQWQQTGGFPIVAVENHIPQPNRKSNHK